jgi:TRAP-type C4-dicarboxylate transport system substrate-binding protein
LSPDQQKLLGNKYGGSWNTLPAEKQQALTRGSQRWLGMTPDQRGQAQQRFQRWQSLPPDQRRVLRDRWERFQSLPPDQRAAVRQNFRRFQQIPPEKRQMLREQWRNASPAERQRMVQQVREQRSRRMQMHGPMHAPPPPRPRH